MTVHRLLIHGFLPKTPEAYVVHTDEDYRVQTGDRTVEVTNGADLVFDDIKIEGYRVNVIRDDEVVGYTYLDGQWKLGDSKIVNSKQHLW